MLKKFYNFLKKCKNQILIFIYFYAFGESNMEDQADIEEVDKEVSKRFKMMSAIYKTLKNRV